MARGLNLFRQVMRGMRGTGLAMRGPSFALRSCFSSLSKATPVGEHPSAPLYFTYSGTDGVELDAEKGTTLSQLFDEETELCFDNYESTKGNHDFSNFSKDIFSKLLTISYDKGVSKTHYFQFDPKSIVVKHLNDIVFDVAVPVSQLQVIDLEAKSVYKDKIVGPFAAMLLSLCLDEDAVHFGTRKRGDKEVYKEIYDLLFRAKTEVWWTSLQQLLSHPLFWSLERKMALLSCMYIWMTSPKKGNYPHGIEGITKRERVEHRKILDFRRTFRNNAFFREDYTFIIEENGEINVSKRENTDDWKQMFIKEKCFAKEYKFGDGKDMHEFYDLVTQCRHIIFHIEDENFTAYLKTLERPTTKVAMIHLDRTFSIALSTFHALREMKKVDITNLLDVSPTVTVKEDE